MSTNINMIRIVIKLNELFQGHVDSRDVEKEGSENKHFEMRALASIALIMKSRIDVSSSCLHIIDATMI